MQHSDLPYRPCVGIALFNSDGKVFVGERVDTPGAWQMPQGGVDDGETIQQATMREMTEEIGTDKATIMRICDKELCYDLPPHLLGRLWNGRYRGQAQTWVALRFTGKDSDIDIEADKTPEFRDWRWINFPEVIDFAVPFKRDTYKAVIRKFQDLIEPQNTNTQEK